MFLKKWTPSECLVRFESLAATTFRREKDEKKSSLFQWLQQLFKTFVKDHQYQLSPIEKAFDSALGSSERLFNPLRSDVKVAVTTTSVRDNMPCIMSNYNGGLRSEEAGRWYCDVQN